VRHDLQRSTKAAIPIVAGSLVALVGAVILAVSAALLLLWVWPQMPLWTGFTLVGGTLALTGAAFILWGKRKFDAFNPLPDQSVEGLKENIQWKTKS